MGVGGGGQLHHSIVTHFPSSPGRSYLALHRRLQAAGSGQLPSAVGRAGALTTCTTHPILSPALGELSHLGGHPLTHHAPGPFWCYWLKVASVLA